MNYQNHNLKTFLKILTICLCLTIPSLSSAALTKSDPALINDSPLVTIKDPGLVTGKQTCGNSIIEGTENCDDGNSSSGDGCSSNCFIEEPNVVIVAPVASCGDAFKQNTEECDDGNQVSGDGCSNTCALEDFTCPENLTKTTAICYSNAAAKTTGEIGVACIQDSGKDVLQFKVDSGILQGALGLSINGFGTMNAADAQNRFFQLKDDGSVIEITSDTKPITPYDVSQFVNMTGVFVSLNYTNNSASIYRFSASDKLEHLSTVYEIDKPRGIAIAPDNKVYIVGETRIYRTEYSQGVFKITGEKDIQTTVQKTYGHDFKNLGGMTLYSGKLIFANSIQGQIFSMALNQFDSSTPIYNELVADLPTPIKAFTFNTEDGDSFYFSNFKSIYKGSVATKKALPITTSAPVMEPEQMIIRPWCADTTPVCGNGSLEDGEACDDGNSINGDGCTAECIEEFCGDNIKQGNEQCDDGNSANDDGCSSICLNEFCGDKIIQTPRENCESGITLYRNQNLYCTTDTCLTDCKGDGLELTNGECIPKCGDGIKAGDEQCDDGNSANNDGCSSNCITEFCGDTIKQTNEECEDGNVIDGDGCSANCGIEASCGDGQVNQNTEQCDDGNSSNNDGCSSLCLNETCGDQTVQTNEECDDGNKISNDGCASNCKFEKCGDGIKQTNEDCDDGNQEDGDGCSANCGIEVSCGDGQVNQDTEQCDDGNSSNNDGCSSECLNEICGDQMVQTDEECDDGNNTSNDGCASNCKLEKCGDGIKQTNEECDDSNQEDGDGCNSNCGIENTCGDGKVGGSETCDDGNNVNNDGCSSTCKSEFCGDNVIQDGEDCDDGNSIDGDGCQQDCTDPICDEGAQESCVVAGALGICANGIKVCDLGVWTDCKKTIEPANEVCDDLDNNCNGEIDEGFDNDGDGFKSCINDCDDNNETIHPDASEICDGIDNNCDDIVDPNCECITDTTKACGSDVGVCQPGLQTCINGQWNDECVDQVTASAETCNNLDDDCNGIVDDTIDADGDGHNICVDCNDTNPAIHTKAKEICDGIDNNCNDIIDEGFDIDQDGFNVCNGDCNDNNAEINPDATEICDKIDNNCDDVIDPDCDCDSGETVSCGSEIGVCKPGLQACEDNKWSPICKGEKTGTTEICNDLDDDCDGAIDEGFDLDEDGITSCAGDCNDTNANINPLATEVCDGIDNNCNDIIDEGCECLEGDIEIINDDVGVCEPGEQTCQNGKWTVTKEAISGSPEECDGIDNDCNGLIDDGVANACGTCGDLPFDCEVDGTDEDCDGIDGNDAETSVCGILPTNEQKAPEISNIPVDPQETPEETPPVTVFGAFGGSCSLNAYTGAAGFPFFSLFSCFLTLVWIRIRTSEE